MNPFHSCHARRSPTAASTLSRGAATLITLDTRNCEGNNNENAVSTKKMLIRLMIKNLMYRISHDPIYSHLKTRTATA